MKQRGRYSRKTRLRVLRACEQAQGVEARTAVLEKFGVPRTTYLAWRKRWVESGSADEQERGRPPARVREIIREEIERGLTAWLGAPPARSG